MARSSWKGFIKLSLVSVPVRAYSAAAAAGGRIALNQLHDKCHSRIRYIKTCPLHGEVPGDEIVKGYEYAKDEYVVVDTDELEKLRSPDARSINIEAFIKPDRIDPIYFAGKSYYLTPDGPAGQKPYALLRQAMEDEGLYCVAVVVLAGREELMVLRPVEGLIAMTALDYEAEVREPASFADEAPAADFSKKELELTKALVSATSVENFDLSRYRDLYTEKLKALIEAKIEGREVVAAPVERATPVINLMDALRASVKAAGARSESGRGDGRRMAPTAKSRKPARKRKTG